MTFTSDCLKDKRYLITGATGGAGRAAGNLIARCGGVVTLMGRDPERTEKAKRALVGAGHTTLVPTSDGVVDLNGLALDGIFHAAGFEHVAGLRMSYGEKVDDVFWPSIGHAFSLLSANCVKDGGSIVMMSSVAAIRGTAGMSIYSASKGAIEALVRAAAVELAPKRIRVNAVRAGAFDSPMHERLTSNMRALQVDDYAARHPLGFGRAEDVANAVVFLLSDAAKWITGSAMAVDGGYSCK